jgi:hypothetical protein
MNLRKNGDEAGVEMRFGSVLDFQVLLFGGIQVDCQHRAADQ